MTYLVVLSFPEKLWSDNLRQETSPRYNAMKNHLDHAVRQLPLPFPNVVIESRSQA